MGVQNGTSQNGNVTERYVFHNSTYYKTERVRHWYVLNNGRVTKRYVLKNGTYYKTVHYETVHVTKQYIFYTINAPIQGFVGYLSYHNLTQDFVSQTQHNTTMARQ